MTRAMKNTHLNGIGLMPSEWKLVKVKKIFNISRGRVIAKTELSDEGVYPVYSSQTKNNGCLGFIDTYDYDEPQLTWTTDGANAGTVFLREGKYNCTNICGTLLPKTKDNNLHYLKYSLAHVAIYHKRADTNGYKIMSNEMAEIEIPLPDKRIQKNIATFLDGKTAQIDSIIENTKQSIIEFKKYKQALITETVTKGLNPEVQMKDSGIEWIGEIPEQWHVSKLKRFSNIRYGLGEPPKLSEDGLPIIRATNIERGKIVTNNLIKAKIEDIPSAKDVVLKHGDILIVRSGAYAGDVALVSQEWEGTLAGYDMIISLFDINPKFTSYALLSDHILNAQLYLSRMRSAQPHLNAADVGKVQIVVPSLSEQQQIADYLDEKCAHIDSLIADKEKLIREFEDYKKALIYEYVTGKKEVE